MVIKKDLFGHTPEGEEVYIFTLRNINGVTVNIINYGGIVTSVLVPDRYGEFDDIVLGFERLADYLGDHPHFGALVGRYANRISNARFELDGEVFQLAANNGNNHLHGGLRGIDKVLWDYEIIDIDKLPALKLSCFSPHGEEGYPGNLNIIVTYSLNDLNEFKIEYEAKTDKSTPVNLSHHGYFNLTGGKKSVLGHELMINASFYTGIDDEFIPTGEILKVDGSALDFRKRKPVGRDIHEIQSGYDHNYVLKTSNNGLLKNAALIYEPDSGRFMEVLTTHPGIQLYTGNFLDGTITGKGGVVYHKHHGLCLETQHFPDSPNKPSFPDTILRPGRSYSHTTIFRFYNTLKT